MSWGDAPTDETRCAEKSNWFANGPVPYHDVNEYYEGARVFVNTSDTEGISEVLICEASGAWYAGRRILRSRRGHRARKQDYFDSILDAMSNIIVRLISQPDEWRAVSLRCRQYVEREYFEERIEVPCLSAICDTSLPRIDDYFVFAGRAEALRCRRLNSVFSAADLNTAT